MAYATANRPERNLPTLAMVTALHVAVGLALVSGLRSGVFSPPEKRPFEGIFVPTENEPKPVPIPEVEPKPLPTSQARQADTPADQPVDTTSSELGTAGPLFPPNTGTGNTQDPGPPFVSPLPTTPAGLKPQGPTARGDAASWVTTDDYPARDLREEREGITRVRLAVGSNGRVTGCEIVRSSGWPGLDAATCTKLTSRARFEPATDETGGKVTGAYLTSVRWQIPSQ